MKSRANITGATEIHRRLIKTLLLRINDSVKKGMLPHSIPRNECRYYERFRPSAGGSIAYRNVLANGLAPNGSPCAVPRRAAHRVPPLVETRPSLTLKYVTATDFEDGSTQAGTWLGVSVLARASAATTCPGALTPRAGRARPTRRAPRVCVRPRARVAAMFGALARRVRSWRNKPTRWRKLPVRSVD